MPKPKDEQSPNDALEQTPDQPLEQSLEQSLETTLEILDEKGLEKWLVDSEYCEALVLWLAEELHVPRSAARIVMRQLAKLCINRGKKFGGWLGRKATNKVNKFILGLPYAKDILNFLHIHAGRAEAAIEAKREARKLFASGKEFVELLPLDVAGQVKILEELEDIDARIMAGFDAILDRLDIQPNLDCFELADPKRVATSIQRFKFNYRFMPLRGREAELELLREFLYHPSQGAGAPLSWFLLLGPGGAGKSRLALEFCLRNSPWRPGFLSYRQMEQFNWDQWRPDQPTLMVIDYCSRDPERLRDMILALRRNRHLDVPVRVLLLERDLGFEPSRWYDRFLGGQTDSESLQATRHAEPLQLPALADEDFKAIITRYRFPESPDLEASITSSLDLNEHLHNFKKLINKNKDLPLFAALYGDVVSRKGDEISPLTIYNTEGLIGDVLNHEERTWGKQLGLEERDWNGDKWREKRNKDFAVLVLAIMTGGLTHRQWRQLPPQHYSKDYDLVRRMSIYTGNDCSPSGCCIKGLCDNGLSNCVSMLFPLHPDILGDGFALRFINQCPYSDKENIFTLRDQAWSIQPLGMVSFLYRIITTHLPKININILLKPKASDQSIDWLWYNLAADFINMFECKGYHDHSDIYFLKLSRYFYKSTTVDDVTTKDFIQLATQIIVRHILTGDKSEYIDIFFQICNICRRNDFNHQEIFRLANTIIDTLIYTNDDLSSLLVFGRLLEHSLLSKCKIDILMLGSKLAFSLSKKYKKIENLLYETLYLLSNTEDSNLYNFIATFITFQTNKKYPFDILLPQESYPFHHNSMPWENLIRRSFYNNNLKILRPSIKVELSLSPTKINVFLSSISTLSDEFLSQDKDNIPIKNRSLYNILKDWFMLHCDLLQYVNAIDSYKIYFQLHKIWSEYKYSSLCIILIHFGYYTICNLNNIQSVRKSIEILDSFINIIQSGTFFIPKSIIIKSYIDIFSSIANININISTTYYYAKLIKFLSANNRLKSKTKIELLQLYNWFIICEGFYGQTDTIINLHNRTRMLTMDSTESDTNYILTTHACQKTINILCAQRDFDSGQSLIHAHSKFSLQNVNSDISITFFIYFLYECFLIYANQNNDDRCHDIHSILLSLPPKFKNARNYHWILLYSDILLSQINAINGWSFSLPSYNSKLIIHNRQHTKDNELLEKTVFIFQQNLARMCDSGQTINAELFFNHLFKDMRYATNKNLIKYICNMSMILCDSFFAEGNCKKLNKYFSNYVLYNKIYNNFHYYEEIFSAAYA